MSYSGMLGDELGLSYSARKALVVHVGESAGQEIAGLLQRLCSQVEELKRTKVNVTPVVPSQIRVDPLAALESETF
jgi:hypothetical protein